MRNFSAPASKPFAYQPDRCGCGWEKKLSLHNLMWDFFFILFFFFFCLVALLSSVNLQLLLSKVQDLSSLLLPRITNTLSSTDNYFPPGDELPAVLTKWNVPLSGANVVQSFSESSGTEPNVWHPNGISRGISLKGYADCDPARVPIDIGGIYFQVDMI